MRVVFVNWADFRAGAHFGGGVNGYLQSLGLELKSRGHEIISLTGGWTYLPSDAKRDDSCRLRRLEDFEGVARFEVVNSPVIAPGIFQAPNPAGEMSAPELERVFQDFMRFAKPDVVHFHNIEGFSSGCIDVVDAMPRLSRPSLVFSLHNYHTICPQVYLMRDGRTPCRDFEGGRACATCVRWPNATKEVALRRGETPIEGGETADMDQSPRVVINMSPVENDPQVEQLDSTSMTGHARRRRAMIAMLNKCDSVLAVSTFVRNKFIAMGIDPDRVIRMPIGTSLAGVVPHRNRSKSVHKRPIRLVFMGYHNHYKGLHMLVDSLQMVDSTRRKRFEFQVLAKDLGDMEARLRSIQDGFASVVIHGEYSRHELPRLLEHADVGVVPSVWWDNGPQTVMEFLSCGVPVLGAEVGGIPDLVRHGENGWLFRGNDRAALARQLSELADRPEGIVRASRNITPMISIAEHATVLLDHYAKVKADRMARDTFTD
ncbi:MAG: glycosyltransferase [Phycisphaerales bacterium]